MANLVPSGGCKVAIRLKFIHSIYPLNNKSFSILSFFATLGANETVLVPAAEYVATYEEVLLT